MHGYFMNCQFMKYPPPPTSNVTEDFLLLWALTNALMETATQLCKNPITPRDGTLKSNLEAALQVWILLSHTVAKQKRSWPWSRQGGFFFFTNKLTVQKRTKREGIRGAMYSTARGKKNRKKRGIFFTLEERSSSWLSHLCRKSVAVTRFPALLLSTQIN